MVELARLGDRAGEVVEAEQNWASEAASRDYCVAVVRAAVVAREVVAAEAQVVLAGVGVVAPPAVRVAAQAVVVDGECRMMTPW